MSWGTIQTDDNVIQVIPLEDVQEHSHEFDYFYWGAWEDVESLCSCQPRTERENGKYIIIHNSFDGREGVEIVNDILSGEIKKPR